MKLGASFVVFVLVGCASQQHAVRPGVYRATELLFTASQTLLAADTDPDGHRIRALRETKAALDALRAAESTPRTVPTDGPPSMATALELLESCIAELEQRRDPEALGHARRAVAEIKAALVVSR